MEQIQLDRLVDHLEDAFGEDLPFSSGTLSAAQIDVLGQVFGDDGYQSYLQDQINRQIIRDFLVNAVMLGYVPEQGLSGIARQVASREGRAALALHMLMSSVEQAADLVGPEDKDRLKRLNPGLSRPPYIKLVK